MILELKKKEEEEEERWFSSQQEMKNERERENKRKFLLSKILQRLQYGSLMQNDTWSFHLH